MPFELSDVPRYPVHQTLKSVYDMHATLFPELRHALPRSKSANPGNSFYIVTRRCNSETLVQAFNVVMENFMAFVLVMCCYMMVQDQACVFTQDLPFARRVQTFKEVVGEQLRGMLSALQTARKIYEEKNGEMTPFSVVFHVPFSVCASVCSSCARRPNHQPGGVLKLGVALPDQVLRLFSWTFALASVDSQRLAPR